MKGTNVWINEHGGKETADRLLGTEPSEGFTQLFLRGKGKLKISVEYIVLKKLRQELFTKEQLAVARKRRQHHQYELPPEG